MTGLRRFIVDDWAEDYRRGRLGRREFLRHLAAFAGGVSLGFAGLESKAPSALAGDNPSVASTSIDPNNNLLLNGKPFLLIQGDGLDYSSWEQAGYTQTDADAKIAQARDAGLNCISANWSTPSLASPYGYQDTAIWNKFGIYWHGAAYKDNIGGAANPITGDPAALAHMVAIVNRYKGRPNLLLWGPIGEADLSDTSSAPDPKTYANNYVAAAQLIRKTDPTHLGVSTICTREGALHNWCGTYTYPDSPDCGYWSNLINNQGNQIPLIEMVMNVSPILESLSREYEYISFMNRLVLANPGGLGWIPSVSTTVLPELFGPLGVCVGGSRIPTFNEIRRYFMLQVAFNCRAFSVLWGPNTRTSCNTGDAGLPPGYLDVWNQTWQVISTIKSMESVILAPGNWIQSPTTPEFAPTNYVTGSPFKGIYAAKKTVAGATYVIAINTQGGGRKLNELPVRGAKIDLGRIIRRATFLPERLGAGPSYNPLVSFSGSTITQDFEPMQVHIYKVSEGD